MSPLCLKLAHYYYDNSYNVSQNILHIHRTNILFVKAQTKICFYFLKTINQRH